MSAVATETTLGLLRNAAKKLAAAEARAHVGNTCETCKARTTLAVKEAKEHIVQLARELV